MHIPNPSCCRPPDGVTVNQLRDFLCPRCYAQYTGQLSVNNRRRKTVTTIPVTNPLNGLIVNVATTAEPPLRLGRCCRNSRPAFDRDDAAPKGVRPDPNYADGAFSLDLGVVPDRPNIFGDKPEAEQDNEDTYGEPTELERRCAKLRRDLGLTTEQNPERARSKTPLKVENLRPVPGFPLKSRLAD